MSQELFQIIFNNNYIRLIILNNLRGISDLFRLMITSKSNKKLIDYSRKSMKITVESDVITDSALKYLNGTFKLEFREIDTLTSNGFTQLNNIDKLIFRGTRESWELISKIRPQKNHIKSKIKFKSNQYGSKCSDISILNLLSTITLDNYFIEKLETNKITSNIKTIISRTLFNYNFHNFKDFLSRGDFSKLKKFKACDNMIDDDIIKSLSNIKSLRKLHCNNCYNITDEGIKTLTQIETLDLRTVSKVTDESFKYLQNLKKLTLLQCNDIFGRGFQYLNKSKLKHVELLGDVQNSTFQSLEGVKYVGISRLLNITKYHHVITDLKLRGGVGYEPMFIADDFNHLKSIKVIHIVNINHLGDEHIKNLVNVAKQLEEIKILNMATINFNITDESLQYLRGVKSIALTKCFRITDKGISYLHHSATKDLSIGGCREITNKSIKYLGNIHKLDISDLPLLTDTGYSQLSHIKEIKLGSINFPLDSLIHFSNANRILISQISTLRSTIPHNALLCLKSIQLLEYYYNPISLKSKQYLSSNGVICQEISYNSNF